MPFFYSARILLLSQSENFTSQNYFINFYVLQMLITGRCTLEDNLLPRCRCRYMALPELIIIITIITIIIITFISARKNDQMKGSFHR
jgi:hypothetical protein